VSEWWQALVLAVLQGLTEFLPISSSAHLILPAQVLGWPDQGLAFDVAVHVGSLLAVLLYFRGELLAMLAGVGRWLSGKGADDNARLVLYLGLATVPAGLAGLLFEDWIEMNLRSVAVIATSTLLFALLLAVADRRSGRGVALGLGVALWVGLAQVLALVPGTSRSGITITAGLMLGLGREQAARFSFLLSIPIIAAAGLLQVAQLASGAAAVNWSLLFAATVVSGVTAYACIGAFLAFVERIGMLPFVLYRVALALVLYVLWWQGGG
jgi:undecaprenyl-diphosphatase